MARKGKRRKQARRERIKRALVYELYGLILLAVSVIALVQPGTAGILFRGLFRFFAGNWDFIIPLLMAFLSIYLIIKRDWPKWHYRWTGVLLIISSLLILNHYTLFQSLTDAGRFPQSVLKMTWQLFVEDVTAEIPTVDLGGGMIGAVLFAGLNFMVAETGTLIVIFFLVLIGVMLLFGISYVDILKAIRRFNRRGVEWLKEKRQTFIEMMKEDNRERAAVNQVPKKLAQKPKGIFSGGEDGRLAGDLLGEDGASDQADPVIRDFTDVAYEDGQAELAGTDKNQPVPTAGPTEREKPERKKTGPERQRDIAANEVIAYREDGEENDYVLPPYSLLRKPSKHQQAGIQDMRANARKLERTLESFGVNAKVTQVHRGPAVTRYEVHPAVGVKVSRIVSLADDIALALAAKGIRIEAPIPGKSAIGIEVPNKDVAMVTLREVLESSAFHESKSKLSIALGRDISGEPIVAQLNKMPHLLVAGATGSGKSVCINSMIASILYKAKPHEVKLMMIDPKMVELNVYNGIPHLLVPVVTDPKKASLALKKVVAEMERRYELFAQSGTRDIEKYNDLIRKENEADAEAKKPLLPYIVVIIDELADLMMVTPGDVEDSICRLAQMARAAGIHLIIATQRPSVDVITGVIKANIPSRIAFGVSSQADSRTILDMGGAEKLLGRGDMLFLPVGAAKPLRVQGAFISDEEVQEVVTYCINQQKAQYHEDMIPDQTDEQGGESVEDELYDQAVELVIQQGSASVSMLQRRFRIGYTRAARLIDAMEANGIVGPYEGSKPREVLVSKEESQIS
ncbi:cell division FtsK/SpoIIIE [Caldalkalibacillus thermarum TA2.A1]|uniref:Cell division FtsK/SpoIIIE n=1 Tax=Caldalkalibacillus thermarum (strain TA2.A1) TaxID=986075 RepID=F5L9S4_CALTT|nr:DNA translocase FtsK [Caldalkalibacillus thermarum]EGL81923.1 cell division FtsK/SpoIIIE [Caldalkalibacillus thermarum TA2.A1]QZT32966.1 DNA translocase FtsK [Caldalkalibacillus thermarum TA2.A1]